MTDNPDNPSFESIRFGGWRQFRQVRIDFHPRLTVITGANGAGKTTILDLLNRHFGWRGQFIATPKGRGPKSSESEYLSDLWKMLALSEDGDFETDEMDEQSLSPPRIDEPNADEGRRVIGSISYTNNNAADISVPVKVSAQYQPKVQGQQAVKGLHIPSHRTLFGYQPVQSISTTPKQRQELFNEYANLVRNAYYGERGDRTPSFLLKSALITLANFGSGNEFIEPLDWARDIFVEFQEVLKIVLPPSLGFEKITIRWPEVVLITKTGEFSIDAVSGGVTAIIDLAWQMFTFAPRDEEYVVTIDEPENHLHPELQRSLIPNLLAAFPKIKFVVATHNPFIVSSVPDSNVYVLRYDIHHRVRSRRLENVNKAGTSNDLLMDVLGLSNTLPIWVERRLEDIVGRYQKMEFSKPMLRQLRSELRSIGMEEYAANAIARIADSDL